jgi:uncharacterized protein (UPF0333 family)
MITHLNQKRGQSTLEYAVLMIVIIAALISIQTYIKRGIQGRLKSASDDIGDQYSPGNTNSIISTRTISNQNQRFGMDSEGNASQGLSSTSIINGTNEKTETKSMSSIVNNEKENWGKETNQ